MPRRFRPRTAGSGESEPRPCAELDKSFAAHEFLEESRKASRGWVPLRGDLVLVSVRVGVKMRAVYVGDEDRRGYGCWAWVIMLGKVRSFPRENLSKYSVKSETPLTPELQRSIRWGFERPA